MTPEANSQTTDNVQITDDKELIKYLHKALASQNSLELTKVLAAVMIRGETLRELELDKESNDSATMIRCWEYAREMQAQNANMVVDCFGNSDDLDTVNAKQYMIVEQVAKFCLLEECTEELRSKLQVLWSFQRFKDRRNLMIDVVEEVASKALLNCGVEFGYRCHDYGQGSKDWNGFALMDPRNSMSTVIVVDTLFDFVVHEYLYGQVDSRLCKWTSEIEQGGLYNEEKFAYLVKYHRAFC